MKPVEAIAMVNMMIEDNPQETYRVTIKFIKPGIVNDKFAGVSHFEGFDLIEPILYESAMHRKMNKHFIKLMNPRFGKKCGIMVEDKDYDVFVDEFPFMADLILTFTICCSKANLRFPRNDEILVNEYTLEKM